jgi:hypothetical protein
MVTDELAFLERVMGTPNGVRKTPAQRSCLAQTFTDCRGQVLPYRMLVPLPTQRTPRQGATTWVAGGCHSCCCCTEWARGETTILLN